MLGLQKTNPDKLFTQFCLLPLQGTWVPSLIRELTKILIFFFFLVQPKKKKFKSKAKTGRKYLQHIYPIRDLYPDSINNVYNPLTRQPEIFFEKMSK